MSRIIRPRIDEGALIDATDLNARFDDYSQSGALDQTNHRDSSIDLSHVRGNAIIVKNALRAVLGIGAFDHSVVESFASAAAGPATPVEVGAGATRLVLGGAGWTVAVGDVIRVYWDINAHPIFAGTPWTAVGADGNMAIDDGAAGSVGVTDGFHCWVLHLEWDVTSNALVNWTPVTGQDGFQTGAGTSSLALQAALTIIPPWVVYTTPGNADEGVVTGALVSKDLSWQGTSGSYSYAPDPDIGSAVTIYGFRVVAHGIYHAAFNANINALELDVNVGGAGQTLDLGIGQISALHQTTG